VALLIWFWNSIYIIKEWERGVVLRLGRLIPEAKSAASICFLADWKRSTRINMRIETPTFRHKTSSRATTLVKVNAVATSAWSTPSGAFAGAELTVRDFAARADDDPVSSDSSNSMKYSRSAIDQRQAPDILDTDTEPWG